MWMQLLTSVAFITAILYLPACLIVRVFNQSWLKSLIYSPLIAVFCYGILGVFYAQVGIRASALNLIAPLLLFELLLFVVAWLLRKRGPEKLLRASKSSEKHDWTIFALYIGVAMIVAFVYYVVPLDGADSFPQDSDNTWHLALIQSFTQSGNLSSLDAGLYRDFEGTELAPLMSAGGAFYPAAWHLLAALSTIQLGTPVPVAVNAVNLVFLVLILPSGFWLLFRVLFGKNNAMMWLGSIMPLAFAAYPWGMIFSPSGPLYPNFAGFALVPFICAIFINLFSKEREMNIMVQIILLFVGIAASGFLHANAVFTAAVLLIPYCLYLIVLKIYGTTLDSKRKLIFSILGCAILIFIVALVWYFVFSSPFLRSTVGYSWSPYASKIQGAVNVLTLAFHMPAAQITLGVVVIVGICYTFYQRRFLWITVSYVISCGFYFVSATLPKSIFIKSLLTGFWYTDTYRLGAMAVLAAIPLAVLGLYVLAKALKALVSVLLTDKRKDEIFKIAASVCMIFFLCSIFAPNFVFPGIGQIETGLGAYYQHNSYANLQERTNLFDQEEKEFVKQVAETVDQDYVIYNNADDGSPFAYATDGLNLAYRRSAAELLDGGERPQSELLRKSIDQLATNLDVQKALKEANIKYILNLDLGGEPLDERCYYGYYTTAKWPGMNNITDETPGLKILLSEGDMRLYEIDYDAFS